MKVYCMLKLILANVYVTGISGLSTEAFYKVLHGETYMQNESILSLTGISTLAECTYRCEENTAGCCAASYNHQQELCHIYGPTYYHQASVYSDNNWDTIVLEDRDIDTSITEYPMSCAEIRATHPCTSDGEYCLAVSGLTNTTHGMRVHCSDMNGAPSEYITLPTGPDENFVITQKVANQPHGEAWFSKIGLDLNGLFFKAGDFTFANVILNGDLLNTVNDMHNFDAFPLYGRSADCTWGGDGNARIDLEGTGFFLPADVIFIGRNQNGHNTALNTRSSNNQRVETKCGGMCSGCEPMKDGVFIYKTTETTDFTQGKLPVDYNLNLDPTPCTFT